ncbi:hypothetical protein GCM10022247_58060 [Allokutzneria multivorans]|uniref:Uncharacterized protein n=1 Tax=Allokutzneria multivorans TaxID=1142134 RepID=A0ABP7TFX4_9PSEU
MSHGRRTRSTNILLAAALALLTSVSVPSSAQAAVCLGSGTYHLDNESATVIDIGDRDNAVLHFNHAPSRPYGPGRSYPEAVEISRIEVVKR